MSNGGARRAETGLSAEIRRNPTIEFLSKHEAGAARQPGRRVETLRIPMISNQFQSLLEKLWGAETRSASRTGHGPTGGGSMPFSGQVPLENQSKIRAIKANQG
jgi:hypothetical protein